MDQERIIAVGLLTRQDLNLLGPTFSRVWPVKDAPDFAELLRSIDEADEEIRHQENEAVGARSDGEHRSAAER